MNSAYKFIFLSGLLFLTIKGHCQKDYLYIGTFSERASEGIYVFDFDPSSGEMNQVQAVSGRESPSFLTIHPSGKYLYAVTREGLNSSKDWGAVVAYEIDREKGKLKFLNEAWSYGAGPCHISLDHTGQWMFVSHYGGGNLAIFPVQQNGGLGLLIDTIQHTGSSVVESRQSQPHLHSMLPSPDNQHVIAADLGIDKLMVYQLDAKNGKLYPAQNPFVKTTAGAGPRHFTWHPKLPFLYLAEEISVNVSAFEYNPDNGALRQIQRLPTLSLDTDPQFSTADIHLDPSGKFLYISNRGHNSISIFQVDQKNGKLTAKGQVDSGGIRPRNFAIHPSGKFLLVANRESDNVVVFKRNLKTGKLISTGISIHIPGAVCLKFLALK